MFHQFFRCVTQLLAVSVFAVAMLIGSKTTFAQVPSNVRAVNPAASPGGNGTSWGNAYNSLQDALDFVHGEEGDDVTEIWLSQGTFKPDDGSDDRSAHFSITRDESPLKIIGGFEGLDSSQYGSVPETFITILSGDINEEDVPGDNSFNIMRITAPATDIRIEGVTFTKGIANGSGTQHNGGAVYIFNGSADFVRCKFIDNGTIIGTFGVGDGGAVYSSASAAGAADCNFIGCTFQNNECGQAGGAIYNFGANLNLTNCVFLLNDSENQGAAIYNQRQVPVEHVVNINNCTFNLNDSDHSIDPGDIATAGPMNIRNSIIWGGEPNEVAIVQGQNPTVTISHSNIYAQAGFIHPNPTGEPPNMNRDPEFVGLVDLRLSYNSPCIQRGADANVPADGLDLDADSNLTELVPYDRNWNPRFVSCVDMGAYEFGNIAASTCGADVAGNLPYGPDCFVDVDDLLFVINHWGENQGGFADFVPSPCGNGIVGVDELLAVINSWGQNCGCGESDAAPQSIEDCMDKCDGAFPGGGEPWGDCVEVCVQGLCEAEIIDCD